MERFWISGLAPALPDFSLTDAVLESFASNEAALCLADENDDIRYASASYRRAFCPHYDGARSNFMSVIAAAIKAGTGIKLVSQPLDSFARYISERRRKQVGSYSFAADTVDGRWWWVTDTKLANGWMLCVAQDVTALKREEFRLRDAHASALEEAQTDDLTGISNRRHGLRRAEQLFTAAQASGDALSIALFDLDHFKGINDRHGHDAGDRALVHLARYIQLATNAADRFSRLGGDEFLLVANTDQAALGRCLVEALEGLPPLDLGDGVSLRLSVSIGVAQTMTSDDAWLDLMRRADRALYDAKASGRCRVACAA